MSGGVFGPIGNAIPLVSASPPPSAYTDLLALFGGNASALAFYVTDAASFFPDGDATQAALDALQAFGTPTAALAALAAAPINQALAFALELAVPLYGVSAVIVSAGSILIGAVDQAPTFA